MRRLSEARGVVVTSQFRDPLIVSGLLLNIKCVFWRDRNASTFLDGDDWTLCNLHLEASSTVGADVVTPATGLETPFDMANGLLQGTEIRHLNARGGGFLCFDYDDLIGHILCLSIQKDEHIHPIVTTGSMNL